MSKEPTRSAYQPEPAQLTVPQMRSGIVRINQRIADLERFDPATVTQRWSPEVKALERATQETLEDVFGRYTTDFIRYEPACHLDAAGSLSLAGNRRDPPDISSYYEKGKRDALAILRQAVKGLEERITHATPSPPTEAAGLPSHSNRIFVVHGHDEAARQAVVRFLEKLGFDAIILLEKANQGATIIEKFEKHSTADFAVILLTPDDVGGTSSSDLRPRARQNVILELGYFVGRLGRSRVCAILKGEIEFPSDIHGIVTIPFDNAEAWQLKLAKELKASGHTVDLNRVMG
jgi:predicted nucleotide-binding protein